ncbi:MAG: glycosyltransferase family 2 protein [Deltaproteobacteria bacterium]|nr:glycosyltransferase family 2 protein [Deltaproteobacteria bacterium]
MIVLELLLVLASVPVLGCSGYLGTLAFLSILPRTRVSRPDSPRTRFDIIVPAHDEEAGIGSTLESLGRLEYPRGLYRVVVVADNCSDNTANKARSLGATVIERCDPTRIGKGHALAFAFRGRTSADAFVVVDADSVVSSNLLTTLDARIQNGARAVQVRYVVRNPFASWRTRLMHLAFVLFHDVRSLGRARLGLSNGLRGNGMALHKAALLRVPYGAYSIVEDIEYGIELARAGVSVEYAHEATVAGEMATHSAASRDQRLRWESGRAALGELLARPLLAEGFRLVDPTRVDLAIDLLIPPLSTIASMLGAGVTAACWLAFATGQVGLAVAPWFVATGLLGLYLVRGIQLSGRGLSALADLAWVPVYLGWKLLCRAFERPPRGWVRTAREGERR